MRRLVLLALPLLAACSSSPERLTGETDVQCIHRLYDYPNRVVPFPTATSECAGGRRVDLTGDGYYQVLASSLNIPFTNRDPHRTSIVLTGSRIPQPTDQPAPPELSLR